MLDRIRFNTTDPQALAADLDRLVDALRRELEAAALRSERRLRLVPGVRTGAYTASFEDMVRMGTAGSDGRVTLPRGTLADAGRQVVVVRTSTANVLKVASGSGVNGTTEVTLPTTRGVYPLRFDGEQWRTTEGT
jgi:hypothetical protein